MTAWPQWIYIALTVFSAGFTLAKHGEPQGPRSFPASCIATCIVFTLLYFGGFFAPIGWAP